MAEDAQGTGDERSAMRDGPAASRLRHISVHVIEPAPGPLLLGAARAGHRGGGLGRHAREPEAMQALEPRIDRWHGRADRPGGRRARRAASSKLRTKILPLAGWTCRCATGSARQHHALSASLKRARSSLLPRRRRSSTVASRAAAAATCHRNAPAAGVGRARGPKSLPPSPPTRMRARCRPPPKVRGSEGRSLP